MAMEHYCYIMSAILAVCASGITGIQFFVLGWVVYHLQAVGDLSLARVWSELPWKTSTWLTALAYAFLALLLKRNGDYRFKQRANNCKPATVYPHWDPVLGLDFLRASYKAVKQNRVLEHWRGVFESVGRTFWVRQVGRWVVFTAEPENAKAILATSFDDWPIAGPRRDAVLPVLGPLAIFSSSGPTWHHARAIMRPIFVRNQIADLACFDRHTTHLLERIPRNGETVDLQDLFYKMTMDSATDFMFGTSTDTLRHPTPEALEFYEMFDYVNYRSAARTRLGLMAFLDRDATYHRGLKVVHAFADNIIARAQREKVKLERNYVFLNEMLHSDETPEFIRSQLLSLILAGRDTTAGALSALFWHLARRPDVVDRLRHEVQELGDTQPTWEVMKDMKYLNMVIKEVLRLYPPVPVTSRTAARDTVLPVGGGPDGRDPLFVPKGTPGRWSSYVFQRRHDLFGDDADEFRPERWETLRNSWNYIPFSGGPRICIGQQFALTQMTYVLIKVFQTFEKVEARDDKPLEIGLTFTTKLPNGVHVAFS